MPPQPGPRKALQPSPHGNSGSGGPKFDDPVRSELPPLAPPPPLPPAASHAADAPDGDFSMMDFLAQVSAMAGVEEGTSAGGGGLTAETDLGGFPPPPSSPFSFFTASFGLEVGSEAAAGRADAPRERDAIIQNFVSATATRDPGAAPAFAGHVATRTTLEHLNAAPGLMPDAHWRLGEPPAAASIEAAGPNAAPMAAVALTAPEHGGVASWDRAEDFADMMAFNFADVFAEPPPSMWGTAATEEEREPLGDSSTAATTAQPGAPRTTAVSTVGHDDALAAAPTAAPLLPSRDAVSHVNAAEGKTNEEGGEGVEGRPEPGQAPRPPRTSAPHPHTTAEAPHDEPTTRDGAAEEDAAPPPPAAAVPLHNGRVAQELRAASSHGPRRLATPVAASASATPTSTPRPAATSAKAVAAGGSAVCDPSSAALQQLIAAAQEACARAAAVERAGASPDGEGRGEEEEGLRHARCRGGEDAAEYYASDAVFFAEAAQVQQQVGRLTEDSARSAAALQAQTSDLLRLLGPHAALSSLVGEAYHSTPVVHLSTALVSLLEGLVKDDTSSGEDEDWTEADVNGGSTADAALSGEDAGVSIATSSIATSTTGEDSHAQG